MPLIQAPIRKLLTTALALWTVFASSFIFCLCSHASNLVGPFHDEPSCCESASCNDPAGPPSDQNQQDDDEGRSCDDRAVVPAGIRSAGQPPFELSQTAHLICDLNENCAPPLAPLLGFAGIDSGPPDLCLHSIRSTVLQL